MRSRAFHSGHATTARPPKRVKLLSRAVASGTSPAPSRSNCGGGGTMRTGMRPASASHMGPTSARTAARGVRTKYGWSPKPTGIGSGASLVTENRTRSRSSARSKTCCAA